MTSYTKTRGSSSLSLTQSDDDEPLPSLRSALAALRLALQYPTPHLPKRRRSLRSTQSVSPTRNRSSSLSFVAKTPRLPPLSPTQEDVQRHAQDVFALFMAPAERPDLTLPTPSTPPLPIPSSIPPKNLFLFGSYMMSREESFRSH